MTKRAGTGDPRPDPLDRISPAVAVEDRVTVRYRLEDGSATDVVGWITDLNSTQVQVRSSRSGDRTAVPRRRIILAKRVPPAMGGPPPSRTPAAELEQIAATGWAADFAPLGDWTMRTAAGFTARANSCLAAGDPGIDIPAAARIVSEHYAGLGLEPMAQVVRDSPEEGRLEELGWRRTRSTAVVLAAPVGRLINDRPRNRSVIISDELSTVWWQAFQRYRPAPEIARRILVGTAPVGLAHLTQDPPDEQDRYAVAIGRGHVHAGWLGLTAVWTDPAHRRRGSAATIMRELGHWGARHGARNAYVQVDSCNDTALRIYERMGFAIHHSYCYLTAPRQPE